MLEPPPVEAGMGAVMSLTSVGVIFLEITGRLFLSTCAVCPKSPNCKMACLFPCTYRLPGVLWDACLPPPVECPCPPSWGS